MHDETYENDLVAEIRRLQEENTTLKATLGMVRTVIGSIDIPAAQRIADNLRTV